MTCKDCMHYEVCYYHDFEECGWFSDKSEWVHLPCKVGDTIYFETYRCGESIGVQHHKVAKINVVVTIERAFGSVGAEIPDWQFGKYVFLTREEAEKALKDRRKEDEGK